MFTAVTLKPTSTHPSYFLDPREGKEIVDYVVNSKHYLTSNDNLLGIFEFECLIHFDRPVFQIPVGINVCDKFFFSFANITWYIKFDVSVKLLFHQQFSARVIELKLCPHINLIRPFFSPSERYSSSPEIRWNWFRQLNLLDVLYTWVRVTLANSVRRKFSTNRLGAWENTRSEPSTFRAYVTTAYIIITTLTIRIPHVSDKLI